MIDVDEIAKECEQMIGDGLDFIAPKSCCNAKQVAELVVMLRDAQKDADRYRWLRDVGRHHYDIDDFFDGRSSCVDGRVDGAMSATRYRILPRRKHS